jgi:hypothetical protein
MKKLSYLASAIAAGFSANAVADVSVSGSGSAAYVNDVTGDGNITIGSSVDFGLSTTTSNGVAISSGLSITVDVDGDAAAAVGGGQSLTFAMDGATIVIGDISVADTPGSVAGVISGSTDDNSGFDSDVAEAFDDDDGLGVSLATSAAGASIKVAYVFDDDNDSLVNTTDANDAASSFGVTMPMGNFSFSAGVADHDNGESAAGASVSAAVGGGTLQIGYTQNTKIIDTSADVTTGFTIALETSGTSATVFSLIGDQSTLLTASEITNVATFGNTASAQDADLAGDTTVFSAAYSMALDADTSFSTSYKQASDAEGESITQFEVSLSRSLGGGASVYIDMANLEGDVDGATSGSAFGFGTSVSF